MNTVEYPAEAVNSARELQGILNHFYGEMSAIGLKCCDALTDRVDLAMIDFDSYSFDGIITRIAKKLGRPFIEKMRRNMLKDLLDLNTQAEALFLEHRGRFSEANNLLVKCGMQAVKPLDVARDMPNISIDAVDDSVFNYDWITDLQNVQDNIQEFITKSQNATDKLLNQLDRICKANKAGEQPAPGEACAEAAA